MIKDEILFSLNYNSLNCGCLSCSSFDHSLKKCPLLNYIPSKSFIIDKLNFSKPQKRAQYSRSDKRNPNSLVNQKSLAISAYKTRFDKDLMIIYNKNNSNLQSEESEIIKSEYNSNTNLDNIHLNQKLFWSLTSIKPKLKNIKRIKSLEDLRKIDKNLSHLFLEKEISKKNIKSNEIAANSFANRKSRLSKLNTKIINQLEKLSLECHNQNKKDLLRIESLEEKNFEEINFPKKTIESPTHKKTRISNIDSMESPLFLKFIEKRRGSNFGDLESPINKIKRISNVVDLNNLSIDPKKFETKKTKISEEEALENNYDKKSKKFERVRTKLLTLESSKMKFKIDEMENKKIPFKIKDFIWFEFELLKSYQFYFPQNNIKNILEIRKKINNKKKTRINLSKKRHSPVTINRKLSISLDLK